MANLRFHESNGVDLALFDDESFDVISRAYVASARSR
jgi:ubiquinone/menaquinone biosynthesis C-methylase UbiE